MSKCNNCISPKMCANFGKDICKAESPEIIYNLAETTEGRKFVPINYKCTKDCFICKSDKTCVVSDNYEGN